MTERGKDIRHAFMPVLVVCLLLLTCTAYAAPAAAQKSTPQVQAAPSAASSLLNPNAPPKGTITISASSKANVNASTWYTGSDQYIQWTCNGTRSNLVDVTLWQYNSIAVVIGTAIATGQTAYTVPWGMPAGQYELRVTSEDDSRVEAKMPVHGSTSKHYDHGSQTERNIVLGRHLHDHMDIQGESGIGQYILSSSFRRSSNCAFL